MSGSIVVRRKVARRSTEAASSTSTHYVPLPKKPKVTVGPKAYRIYSSRRRLVIRFFVAKHRGTWVVADSFTWCQAEGTGTYQSKEEAVEVAREYRDSYGAYCKSPF